MQFIVRLCNDALRYRVAHDSLDEYMSVKAERVNRVTLTPRSSTSKSPALNVVSMLESLESACGISDRINDLVKRIWYIRWDVPADVRHAFNNQRTMKKALSSNKADAQLKSLELLHAWKTLTTHQVRKGQYDPENAVKTALLEVKSAYKFSEEDIALNVVRTADAPARSKIKSERLKTQSKKS